MTSQPFVVMVPTYDGLVQADLPAQVVVLAKLLDRPLFFSHMTGIGVADTRTRLVQQVAEQFSTDKFRGLFVDSDVTLNWDDLEAAAQAITKADENHWNIVAPVRLRTGRWNIYMRPDKEEESEALTDAELEELEDFSPCYCAGLAFYYGDIVARYSFHQDGLHGEDWNYFLDNRIRLRVAKIRTYHWKRQPIK